MAKIKNTADTKCWQDAEQLYFLYFADGNKNWYNHSRKQFGSFL